MPPQYSSISSRTVMPAGGPALPPRLLDAAGAREAAQALAAVAALAGEPFGAALDDVAHPIHGLDVVDQGRAPEQPDLRRIGRLVPGHAALALDALQHRRLLAADISGSAAAQGEARPGG